MRLVVIDNQDSFTWNWVHLLGEILGEAPTVLSNRVSLSAVVDAAPDAVVISPGPGRADRANDFGVCASVIADGRWPLLGVCLGHQGLGLHYGALLRHAPQVMHGYLSEILHEGDPLFEGVGQAQHAVRYHSQCLVSLSSEVRRIAWTQDDVVMAIRIANEKKWGVQFHPESVLTDFGATLARNFLDLSREGEALAIGKPPGRGERLPLRGRSATWRLDARELPFKVDPAAAFLSCFADVDACWLDGQLDPRARFTVMGVLGSPVGFSQIENELLGRTLESSANVLDLPFVGGWIGALAYEAFEPDATDDSLFGFVEQWVAWDHQSDRCALYRLAPADTSSSQSKVWFDHMEERLRDLAPVEVEARPSSDVNIPMSISDDEYRERVARARGHLFEGESYELCLTDCVQFSIKDRPLDYYLRLRQTSPAPYAAFLRVGDRAVASSSPERFLRIDREGNCEAKPIKGTTARGQTEEEDRNLSEALSAARYRAENLMIVDLLRNDLGRVCELGTVSVPHLMKVESYANVHQLVSTIVGRLRAECSSIDAIRSAFPGGSMTGAPKIRSMDLLKKLEGKRRGLYSGALGYLGVDGAVDLSIVIRSAVFEGHDATVGTGGAVVYASDPEEELREAKLKIRPLVACRS